MQMVVVGTIATVMRIADWIAELAVRKNVVVNLPGIKMQVTQATFAHVRDIDVTQ